jgi:hypothetical protein
MSILGVIVERRRHQRCTCIFEATLEGGEKQRFLPVKLARVVNISRGGLSLHSADKFDPGNAAEDDAEWRRPEDRSR